MVKGRWKSKTVSTDAETEDKMLQKHQEDAEEEVSRSQQVLNDYEIT